VGELEGEQEAQDTIDESGDTVPFDDVPF